MASYLQVENISKSYGDRMLFSGIGFNINEGDKIALIAPNGTGKSTLLKILAGVESSDRGGEVRFMKSIKVAFLDQATPFDPNRCVFDEVYSRLDERTAAVREYDEAVASGDRRRMDAATAAMDVWDGWSIEQDIRQGLSSLHIDAPDRRMGQLSGGEAKRVALAVMMLQKADFLILDEPTNHLDIEIIEYLESYLQRSRCTLLMVTHDRYFLDRVCNTIFEIDRGELVVYKGSYSDYLAGREERYAHMQADIDKSRNLLRRELEWIRSTPQARTGKARYRVNAFYDLKERAAVSLRTDSVDIDVAQARLGRKIVDCYDIDFAYGDKTILDGFSYKFTRGEKVGIVGCNGAGKSTFLDIMAGLRQPAAGRMEHGETLRIGYYRQQGISFRPGQTILDTVTEIADEVRTSDGRTISATSYLTKFLFPPETFNKRVDILSGGEQRRLYLLTVLMRNPNMLILDEPTNDLDILTLNVLEEYLQQFEGSLLIVSHDRYFLDKTTDHLFVFEGNGRIRDFVGRYSEYREYLRQEQAEQRAGQRKSEQAEANPPQPRPRNAERRRLSYKEQREVETIEAELASLTDERTALEASLSSGSLSYDELAAASERIRQIIAAIDEKEMRWLELNE